MLTTLRIKNLALVADLTLELGPGLNVISGETGAGKSILLGALTLVLGQRADRTLIRSGSDTCAVEAVFEVSDPRIAQFMEDNALEPCENQQLLLKRVFTASGSNRQFINGSPTTLTILASLGEWLVDIHGPHDHQSLLYPARQLAILDAFGSLHPFRRSFAELLRQRSLLQARKADLIVDEKTYAQQVDLLRFQTHEISAANLKGDEETELEQEYQRAVNAARLLELSQQSLDLLGENDASLLHQSGALGRLLHELERLDATAAPLLRTHENVLALWQELQRDLSHYADRIELDPARLQQLEERINLIHGLKRKYGSSVEEVIRFGVEARDRLNQLEQRETTVARLNSELRALEQELWRAGRELSEKRRKLSGQLAKAVGKELSALGFKRGQFEVALQTQPESAENEFVASGIDTAEFQFAPNVGEPLRPLRAIASSGEMARVMLALKTVLAAEDDVPVLVFDEVDANVGGETATAVGEKMKQIAARRQVLCITHLAPVAAYADAHYMAAKHLQAGRTVSKISLLQEQERVVELARMLGGQTETARKHAAALLEKSR